MNNKKIVKVSITICLVGIVCLICYLFSKNSKSTGISLSDDNEERVIESSDSESSDSKQETSTDLGKSEEGQTSVNEESIAVHVCGQVKNPGVYALTKGARVSDAIEAAGGLTKEAAGDFINQAQKLEDEQQVYVPNQEEVKESPEVIQQENGYNEGHSLNKDLININQATREELMTLPGIGEAKADMIISYREEHGRFATIEEIKNISGIKDGVYSKICDLITTD
ncbi:helix-hairpin-helix domain-containing protein [Anaerosporobacter sp.]